MARSHSNLASAAIKAKPEPCPTKTTKESVTIDQPGPPIPPLIAAWIHEDWKCLDPDGPEMIETFKSNTAFSEFAHARAVFKDHLKGTFATLANWGQSSDVRRCGLFHTGYSGDLFQFCFWDATSQAHRAELRSIVGPEAEHLTYLFGTIDRGQIAGLNEVIDPDVLASPKELKLNSTITIPSRTEGEVTISSSEAAKIICVTLADYLDQMVEINGWRDHHQVEEAPSLYPGDGRPALSLYWLSAMCGAMRPHLEVVPAIFNHCTVVLPWDVEKDARDAYWEVVLSEANKSMTEQQQLIQLTYTVERNPFVGEPHILMAQIHFRRGRFEEAIQHTSLALKKLYTLASQWDKRLNFDAWVGYARLLQLRASRKKAGLYSLPTMPGPANLRGGLPLVSLRELCEELP